MFAVPLLLAYAVDRATLPAQPGDSWCDSIYTVALATAEARSRGVPRATVDQAARQLPTSEARRAADAIADLAYGAGRDSRLSPRDFAGLVKQACLNPGN